MRANNPRMAIIVQQLIPMNPANCPPCASRVVALNAAIPAWAASVNTPRSPVTVVDQWPGFSTATDTYDGVHPNASGAHKIADRLYPAVVTALRRPR
jgi:lysophospholipase L1-like esterase